MLLEVEVPVERVGWRVAESGATLAAGEESPGRLNTPPVWVPLRPSDDDGGTKDDNPRNDS